MRTAAAAIVALLATTPALAGRPLTTDDASVLDEKNCQLESWVDRAPDTTVAWAVPTCNFGLGIEWQAGFARIQVGSDDTLSDKYFQAKTLLRKATEESPWALGMTVGVNRAPRSYAHQGWDLPYVLVPVSVTSGIYTLHVQPGWTRDREQHRDMMVWGVALEAAVTERLTFLAESFGVNASKPFARAGLRWTAIKDRLDLDLTQVVRIGGTRAERFTSLGLTWVTGAILP